MKICVFTLGCKVNSAESDSLIRGLVDRGHEVTDELVKADLYIVNTCAVTAEAEKKSRQTAARIARLNPAARIIYTGCASQKDPYSFAAKANTALVTGTFAKGEILDMLDRKGVCLQSESEEFEELLPVETLRTRSYVKVQDGCDNFCTYCIIPYLRGRSRSRTPEKIIEEIAAVGSREVVLNGVNLSAYDCNGVRLAGLMRRLKGIKPRVRLGSLEAGVIDEELLAALKDLDFAEHFHLSLQSGSDEVLRRMNRRYTAAEFKEKVALIRGYYPYAAITTDIIAGFPGETEEDFAKTLALIDDVKFADIHCFAYSPREGTMAYTLKDLPSAVKKRRLEALLEKKEKCRGEYFALNARRLERVIFEEYVDGYSLGYSGNYIRTYVAGRHEGEKTIEFTVPYRDGMKGE